MVSWGIRAAEVEVADQVQRHARERIRLQAPIRTCFPRSYSSHRLAMATPYQDAAASHTGTPYTYAPPAPAQSPQVATPDPAQYASTSQPQMSATPTPYQQYTPTPAQPASQPQAQPQSQQSQAAPAAGPSRRPDEEAKKDRTLAEFLLMLDDYEPLVGAQSGLVECCDSPQHYDRFRMK